MDPDPGGSKTCGSGGSGSLTSEAKIKKSNRPPKRTAKLQEKPSALLREHPALRNMKFLSFFLFLWVSFALLDRDPLTGLNPDRL
jgi:hypothetical protein